MRALFLSIVAALVAALAVPAAAAPQPDRVGPSFDCAAAKDTIDQTICGDSGLAEADRLMARLYSATKVSAFGRGPSNQLVRQREWLKERAKSCGAADIKPFKSRAECLNGYYTDRNHALAVAALFSEPELALATLKRLDPEAAPLYEAITLYANARSPPSYLLQPYFDKFQTDEARSYGRDILADDRIRSPAHALASEQKFAEFLKITSAYLRDDPIPRPFPCAAIVRRPGLLAATGPVFGSTLDNFTFYPDCDDTLPPTPKLQALVDRINNSWPDCEGTIRYAAYRAFGLAVNGARAAGAAQIKAGAKSKARDIPRLKGVPPALANAAVAELANYYQRWQGVDAASARAFAAAQVRDIMAGGHACD